MPRTATCSGCGSSLVVQSTRGPLPSWCGSCKEERRRERQRKPAEVRTFRVLSLGAGQQSSALLVLSALGRLPKLDLVVFADTQWERQVVYENVDRLEGIATDAGIRFERVSVGPLRDAALGDFVPMPVYGHQSGKPVVMRQACTMNWKIKPIRRRVRELAGPLHGLTVEMWLGISSEEVYRLKPSPVEYIEHVYPLIDMKWTRADCVGFLADQGLTDVPRSSCIGCPYKSASEFRTMATEAPEEWADAVDFDERLRSRPDPMFVHYSRRPLPLILGAPVETDLWGNECQGYCGT